MMEMKDEECIVCDQKLQSGEFVFGLCGVKRGSPIKGYVHYSCLFEGSELKEVDKG